MPWNISDLVTKRIEFVQLAEQGSLSMAELCRRFAISRKTGYKWLQRQSAPGADARVKLQDQSRRPRSSPLQIGEDVERLIIDLRQRYPYWGARKLRALLEQHYQAQVPVLPAVSTVHQVIKRQGLISAAASQQATPFTRFEHAQPNDLWQMDHKGYYTLLDRSHAHPLTVLDDHSRYNLVLDIAADQRAETVQQALIQCFRTYGLPRRMTMDNGSPWGDDAESRYTRFTVWLLHLGIDVSHSRPYHPQTQGKDERFHRTLDIEIFQHRVFADRMTCQHVCDQWRQEYNHFRPHEAIGLRPPASRYQASVRPYPERLPTIEYAQSDEVRLVQSKGFFSFKGRTVKVSKAFRGYPVALRPTLIDGIWEVYFKAKSLGTLSLQNNARLIRVEQRQDKSVTYVPEQV